MLAKSGTDFGAATQHLASPELSIALFWTVSELVVRRSDMSIASGQSLERGLAFEDCVNKGCGPRGL